MSAIKAGQVWEVTSRSSNVGLGTRIAIVSVPGQDVRVSIRYLNGGNGGGMGSWLPSSIRAYCTLVEDTRYLPDSEDKYDHEMHNLQLVAENSSLIHKKVIDQFGRMSPEWSDERKYFIRVLRDCMKYEDHPIDEAQASVILYKLWDAWKTEQEVINQPTKEETTMQLTDKLQQRAFIGNEDVSDQSDDFFFNRIAKLEGEIKKLDAITNKPEKLKAKIQALYAEIEVLVKHVDAR